METTLSEAIEKWESAIAADGGRCPCCNRFGKIYSRHFNKTMAWSLLWLWNTGGKNFVDVPNTAPTQVLRSNQLPTVRWWGLIERKENNDTKNKHSGFWRVTDLGADIINGKCSMPKTVFTYDADVVRFGDEHIKFNDAFHGVFDYSEVMGARYDQAP